MSESRQAKGLGRADEVEQLPCGGVRLAVCDELRGHVGQLYASPVKSLSDVWELWGAIPWTLALHGDPQAYDAEHLYHHLPTGSWFRVKGGVDGVLYRVDDPSVTRRQPQH